jgi:hypothetical protein
MAVAFSPYGAAPRAGPVGWTEPGSALISSGAAAASLPSTLPFYDLHVSARRLRDLDTITVSDPLCVMDIWAERQWREFSRTEVVANNLNPEWVKSFRVMYVFEKRQRLRFRVFDVDSELGELSDQDFIGQVEIDLREILGRVGATELELRAPGADESRGTFVVVAEEVRDSASLVQLAIEGIELPRSSFCCRGDPFFVIAKCSESGRWLPVFQSEDMPTMRWARCTVPVQVLCNADYDWPIRISFFVRRGFTAGAATGYVDATFARLGEMVGQVLPVLTGRGVPRAAL